MARTDIARLYYEAHVTIEPVFEDDLERTRAIAQRHGFKPAELLMKKRAQDTAERSKYDTFCTGRGKSYIELESRMMALIADLKADDFKVWRYKIEDTICDSRSEDVLKIL